MPKQVRVTAIYNKEPEIRLYVLALIGLARQLAEEEAGTARHEQRSGTGRASK
jgi:hypothetical protein